MLKLNFLESESLALAAINCFDTSPAYNRLGQAILSQLIALTSLERNNFIQTSK